MSRSPWMKNFGLGGEPPSEAPAAGNGRSPFSLERGRLTAQERALLGILHRFCEGYPGQDTFTVMSLWLQYSACRDTDRGNGAGLRVDFDQALGGLAAQGLIEWSGDTVRLL